MQKLEYKPSKVWELCIKLAISPYIYSFGLLALNSSIANLNESLDWEGSYLYLSIFNTLYPGGAAIGAFSGAEFGRRYGKRKVLLRCSQIYILFSLICSIPTNLTFGIGRFCTGVIGGITMGISPSFINEMTPDKMTGQVGTLIQQAGNSAFISSYILGLAMPISNLESNPYNYLWMIIIIFPSILCLYQIYFFTKEFPYESPAWLLANGHHDRALETFSYVYYPEFAHKGIERLNPPANSPENDSLMSLYHSTYKDVLCKSKFRKMFRISMVLNIGQQTSGSMMMRIYATKIFEDIGGGKRFAQIFTVIAGAVSLTGSITTIFLLKRFGRKTLLIVGQIGMSIIFLSLALLGDFTDSTPQIKAIFIFIYFGFLSISLGPTFWAYIGEVCNDKCISIGFSLNLVSVMILSFAYPIAQAELGISFCFYVLSFMCVCLLLYEIIELFETKGLSKQEIQLKVFLLPTNE